MKLVEEGQHVKWAPVLVEHDAVVLDSAVALHVEQLQLSKGCMYSPLSLQQHFSYY